MRPGMVRKSLKRFPIIWSAACPIQPRKVRFTYSMRPPGEREMYPHGAFSIMASKLGLEGPSTRGHTKVRIADTTSSGALRFGQWPVALSTIIRLFGMVRFDEVADRLAGDDVLAALKDQRRYRQAGEIFAVVRREGHAGE